jgi:hypothetical protein
MAANVVIKDLGWKAIGDVLKKYQSGKAAAVGVQGTKASEDHDGITNAELGAIHEYGTQDGRIPARSWLGSTAAEQEANVVKELKEIATKKVYEGKEPVADIAMMGENFRGKVLEKIKSNIPPALAESTIKQKKGETIALIKDGQFWNSISSEVVDPKSRRS